MALGGAGLSATDVLLAAGIACMTGGRGGSTPDVFKLRSRIAQSSYAVRLAERMSDAAQSDVDALLAQFRRGNEHPGIGSRGLGNGFVELRGRNGGRVIVRRITDDTWDIVGKFQGHARGDAANSAIIERLIKDYLSLPGN